ncbi:hypothetical protein DL96DRAFT_1592116 [Flagelloscypha sp. PMI_526]|nr:hypothetical protein DL96DRAFT_1592116 [Flagelloscypha sp. PMI_526]
MAANSVQDNSSQQSLDSITLGQLRAMVNSVPKPKQWWYDFNYDDEDSVMNELDEFYSYVEMPQVAENLKAWEASFSGEWTKTPIAQKKAHINVLLESLEHRDAEIRFTNARRLFYVLQGTFAETGSPEQQLHWIFENCKLVRSSNGVSSIVEAIKIAQSKHDLLCGLSEAQLESAQVTQEQRNDLMEEVTTEISVYFGMLYHFVEIFKGHDDFADELMSLDPPLPVYMFGVVASLKDKPAKGYPIKKLLLIVWKVLLACCGGIRDHVRVKKLSRELSGLPPIPEGELSIKATPLDLESFRHESGIKYPTFSPPSQILPRPEEPDLSKTFSRLTTSKLSQAYTPIPVRHHYHHDDIDSNPSGLPPNSNNFGGPNSQFRPGMPQPATPAPSPPPSPKPKKQQYQTDQTRPFLFPFSRSRFGDGKLIPFAIDEADRLYNKHMYISTALTQMWKTREDCMTAESGLNAMPGEGDLYQPSVYAPQQESETDENPVPLPDLALLDAKISEATEALEKAETTGEKRKAKERREDLLRLKRVEQIYSAVLPQLSGWVLVLLKLLLASASANSAQNTGQPPNSANTSFFPPGVSSPPSEQPPPPPPTLDEIDILRHREITSKAVSATILLVLKWYKVSHVMKFHHLGQHLLDTNCLLLLLKMFGLQEVSSAVVSRTDSPEHNFFRYCVTNFSRHPQHIRPEDSMIRPPQRQTITKVRTLPNGEKVEEEIEMVADFSWRNFFSTINFAKIMQKLSKHRSHRIWMLVQYKSSAVLKRLLRVQHPMLQSNVLKLIKSQVPFCGRKWRQSNMKVITSIYMNIRPDLRDEWLTGTEVDEASDCTEQALRHLVKFYNTKRYGSVSANAGRDGPLHRRSGSISNNMDGLHPGPELNLIRPMGTPNMDPAGSQAPDPSIFLPYIPEDIAFEEEYEEYLSDLGFSTADHHPPSAWQRLPELVSDMTDGISDSESIVSIADLDNRLDHTGDEKDSGMDENLNNWEHMSPKTMAVLSKSPGHRRTSSGSSPAGALRPVLDDYQLDGGSAIAEDEIEEEDLGLAQREQTGGPFATGAAVDEVEYAYGKTIYSWRQCKANPTANQQNQTHCEEAWACHEYDAENA